MANYYSHFTAVISMCGMEIGRYLMLSVCNWQLLLGFLDYLLLIKIAQYPDISMPCKSQAFMCTYMARRKP